MTFCRDQMRKRPSPNPYKDRGREQFALVLAELDAKRKLIAAKTGKSPEEIKFQSRGGSLIPVVTAASSNPNSEPIKAINADFSCRSSRKALFTRQAQEEGQFAAERNVCASIPLSDSSSGHNPPIIVVTATLLLSGAEIGLIWLWRTVYSALISLIPLFFLLTFIKMTNFSVSHAISPRISNKQGSSEIKRSADEKQKQIKQKQILLRKSPCTGMPVWGILSLVLAVLTIGRIPAILITAMAWYIYPVIQTLVADFSKKIS